MEFIPELLKNEIHIHFSTPDQLLLCSIYLLDDHHVMQRPLSDSLEKTLNRIWSTYKSKKHKKPMKVKSKAKQSIITYNQGARLHNKDTMSSSDKQPFCNHDTMNGKLESLNDVDYNNLKTSDALVTAPNEQKIVLTDEQGLMIDIVSLTNKDFMTGMKIQIETHLYNIVCNMPRITLIHSFPYGSVKLGHSIVPTVTYEFADEIIYTWCKESAPNSKLYTVVSHDRIFQPKEDCVGCNIKLYCHGRCYNNEIWFRSRDTVHYITGVVEDSSRNKMLEVRHDFNNIKRTVDLSCHRQPNELRVISYNVLADAFATSKNSLANIYPYVDPVYLQSHFRNPNIWIELDAYDGDIIGLQECEGKVFDYYFQPLFQSKGYDGYYAEKAGSIPEGCATFINHSKFRTLYSLSIPLQNLFKQSNHLEVIYSLRSDIQDVLENKLGTTVQITIVQSLSHSERILLIANTHLYYHPAADYIRLLQSDAIVKLLSRFQKEIDLHGLPLLDSTLGGVAIVVFDSFKQNSKNIEQLDVTDSLKKLKIGTQNFRSSVMLLGDLNSSTDSVAVEYLESGVASMMKMNKAWERLQQYGWGRAPIESIEPNSDSTVKRKTQRIIPQSENTSSSYQLPSFSHDLGFISAAGHPRYSNYVVGFQELLDWVFIQSDWFETKRIAPFPNEDELTEYQALRSKLFPSDHMAIAVDIQFKK